MHACTILRMTPGVHELLYGDAFSNSTLFTISSKLCSLLSPHCSSSGSIKQKAGGLVTFRIMCLCNCAHVQGENEKNTMKRILIKAIRVGPTLLELQLRQSERFPFLCNSLAFLFYYSIFYHHEIARRLAFEKRINILNFHTVSNQSESPCLAP